MTSRKVYYNISFSQLVLMLLPPILYTDIAIALASALLYPLAQIHKAFTVYIAKIDTSVNSQICYMQSILNDRYDYYDRRIIVRDSDIDYNSFFLFDEGTGDASMLYNKGDGDPTMWVDTGLIGSTNVDFDIVFPLGYEFSNSEYKALIQLVNDNKLASKRFKIVYA